VKVSSSSTEYKTRRGPGQRRWLLRINAKTILYLTFLVGAVVNRLALADQNYH
jgi:hypothetical protein